MNIFDNVARRTNDEWVLLGNGGGIIRVDTVHVAVRLANGRVTLAVLPIEVTSSTPLTPTEDMMPLEGVLLLAEPMGNKPPQSDQLRIDVSSIQTGALPVVP